MTYQISEYLDTSRDISIGELHTGIIDTDGFEWVLTQLAGWGNQEIRGYHKPRSWADGAWASRRFIDARRITISITITAPYGARKGLTERINFVKSQLPLKKQCLLGVLAGDASGGAYVITEGKISVYASPIQATITATLVSLDNRVFKLDPDSGALSPKIHTTGLPDSAGGLMLPFTLPAVIDSRVVSGVLDFTVGGTQTPKSKIKIYGPTKNPAIDDAYGTKNSFNLTLADGEYLEIRVDERQVLLNGQSSRRGAMIGPWPDLSPGHHRIQFSHADTFNSDARLEIEYLEAF